MASQIPGTIHRYTSKLVAYEHTPDSSTATTSSKKNIVLWIGGLGDGLVTVEYPTAIAKNLPSSWSLAQVLISSSYEGWRTGSLERDANEIAECVKYFRSAGKEKVVLMGHSTGCQDIMQYLTGKYSEGRAKIDGAILQGSVSDREACAIGDSGDVDKAAVEKRDAIIAVAKGMIDEGRAMDPAPRRNHPLVQEGEPAVSAYRTNSLLAAGGDDDFFSSDLPQHVVEETFGRLAKATKRVMFLLGGEDQYAPKSVDKQALLAPWVSAIKESGGFVDEENGGVVPGGTHNFNGDAEEVVQDLVTRVVKFLERVESG